MGRTTSLFRKNKLRCSRVGCLLVAQLQALDRVLDDMSNIVPQHQKSFAPIHNYPMLLSVSGHPTGD
jgi:hypothetical protein